MEPLKIRIKYLRDIDPIELFPNGDWIDLRCAERTVLRKGDYRLIPLGFALQLPEGFLAVMAPRSSTFRRHGVLMASSIGIIDESYCGDNDEWHFPAYATRDTVIKKNERICQFNLARKQPPVELVVVEHLGNPDRGGLGSTGTM